jgi:hypothetical protein
MKKERKKETWRGIWGEENFHPHGTVLPAVTLTC